MPKNLVMKVWFDDFSIIEVDEFGVAAGKTFCCKQFTIP